MWDLITVANEIRTRAGIKERGQPTANCVKSELVLTWVVGVFSGSDVSDSLQPHRLQHVRLSITNSQSLLRLMSIESVMPSNHLIFCHPLVLLLSLS